MHNSFSKTLSAFPGIALAWAFCISAHPLAAAALPLPEVPALGDTATRQIAPVQLHDEIIRLQGLLAACQAAAQTCKPDQVGPDLRVGEPNKPGGFEVHWTWLRQSLAAKPEDRSRLLPAAASQLSQMLAETSPSATTPDAASTQTFSNARSTADSILGRAEFNAVTGPTWWQRKQAQLVNWLARLFSSLGSLGVRAPWLGRLLEWLCFTAAAVGLLVFLLRTASRQRQRIALSAASVQSSVWHREAGDWAARAELHAEAHELRDALHCLYWAAIILLESRRAWRHNPTRTPREYLRLLRTGSTRHTALRGLTQAFEQTWYGLRDVHADDYTRARALYDALHKDDAASADDIPLVAHVSTLRHGLQDPAEGQ